LKKSDRPLFLIGAGARISGCSNLLKIIIKRFPFAFVTTWNAMDLIPHSSNKFFGKPGSVALRPANFAVQNCDLLISIGARLDNVVTGFNIKGFARKAQKIVIDIDKNELKKFNDNDFLKIQSDAKIFLQKLLDELELVDLKSNKEWLLKCNSWKEKYGFNDGKPFKNNGSISHGHIVDTLSKKIRENTLIVTGSSGLGVEAFYVYFRNKSNQRIFHTTGLGAMGYCLPAIIGSHFANNKKKIVAIEGDGSLQMNIQELAVIKGLNIPATIFIFDNNGYASIRNTQKNYFKSNFIAKDKKSKLFMPNLEKILEAHGISYEIIKKIEEMEKTVDLCLNKNCLNVCVVKLKQNDILQPKLKNILQHDGSLKSMPLEDLSPMLTRKVLKNEMIIPLHENSLNVKEL
jgi:acetolactate synthase-1/2/3 large subunit